MKRLKGMHCYPLIGAVRLATASAVHMHFFVLETSRVDVAVVVGLPPRV